MTGAELTAAESKRRAAIAALAAADDARLRWRHLLLLGVALTAMTLCGLGVAGSVWTPAARLLGSSSSRLRGLVPILLAAYLLAAPVPRARGLASISAAPRRGCRSCSDSAPSGSSRCS